MIAWKHYPSTPSDCPGCSAVSLGSVWTRWTRLRNIHRNPKELNRWRNIWASVWHLSMQSEPKKEVTKTEKCELFTLVFLEEFLNPAASAFRKLNVRLAWLVLHLIVKLLLSIRDRAPWQKKRIDKKLDGSQNRFSFSTLWREKWSPAANVESGSASFSNHYWRKRNRNLLFDYQFFFSHILTGCYSVCVCRSSAVFRLYKFEV